MNNRLFLSIFVGLIALSSVKARAGGWSSGGGDGLVCFGPSEVDLAQQVRQARRLADPLVPKIKSIEPLDLFLAKLDDASFEPIEIAKNESTGQFVDRLVSAYPTVPSLSKLIGDSNSITSYRGYNSPLALEIDSAAVTAPDAATLGAKLRDLGLSFPNCVCVIKLEYDKHDNLKELAAYVDPNVYFKVPPNCAIVALARNYLEIDETETQDLVSYDQRLWNSPANSPLNKAVLLIHEWFYTQGLKRNQLDSSRVHEVVIAMLKKNSRLSPSAFSALLERTGFMKPASDNLDSHPDSSF